MHVLPHFSFARQKLRERYESAADACRALKDVALAKMTIYHLFDSKRANDKFTANTQRTVIDLIQPNLSMRAYARVIDMIKATREEVRKLASYTGHYRYFRKDNYGHITSGYIQIYFDDESYKFRHWPSEKSEKEATKAKPRHEGFVFIQGDRIHLLGLGERYIRPAVTHVCEDVSANELHGFVITVSSKARGASLFAARFVMIHETNPKYKETTYDISNVLEDSSKEPGLLKL